MAQLRDIRNGKGEKEKGLDAYIWLATHHPRTLQANLSEIVKVRREDLCLLSMNTPCLPVLVGQQFEVCKLHACEYATQVAL